METQASASAEAGARPPLTAQPGGAQPPQDAPSAGSDLPPPSGVKEAFGTLWEDLRGALAERAKLLSLELRLATMTLVQVLVMAVIVAVLAVTCWVLLVAGIVAGLAAAGLHWALALVLLIAILAGTAYFLVRTMLRSLERLSLPHSLGRRKSAPAPAAPGTTPMTQEAG